MIAGGPGSGKSSAAVLLVLAALRYRRTIADKDRAEVPVPVMFTLHGWDPSTQRAQDWLAERLWQTYPLFAGRQGAAVARAMIEAGRIAVILDGLDEVPGDLQPVVLQALSQQATFRLVLLARSGEIANTAKLAVLQGAAAIELQDITPRVAADYLSRTQLAPLPGGWQELTRHLRQEPGSPLAQVLSNPLMVTLVRDTYRTGDDIGELLGLRDSAGHPASSQDIADYLLDRVLPAAYTQQPGEPPPRYSLPAAERALRRIAARMNTNSTRDLQWWHVPAWTPAAPRFVVTSFGAGLVFGLAFGLVERLVEVPGKELVAGLWAGLWAAIAFGRRRKVPMRMTLLRWRQLFGRRPLTTGVLAGTVTALLFALSLLGDIPALGERAVQRDLLGLGLAAGFVAWIAAGLVTGISRPGTDSTSSLSPLSSWRSDRVFGLAAGLTVGLVVGLVFGGLFGLSLPGWPRAPGVSAPSLSIVWPGLEFAFVAGLVAGITFGLAYPQTWACSLAFVQLAASDRTPVRLMRFLEDARGRSVLRTVGPVYQFRHARLQDRLAAQEHAAKQNLGKALLVPEDAAGSTAEAPPAGAT